MVMASGCSLLTPSVQYVSQPLPLPVPPKLVAIKSAELACITDATYQKIVDRELARKHYAGELRAVILATQQVAK